MLWEGGGRGTIVALDLFGILWICLVRIRFPDMALKIKLVLHT